MGLSSTVTINSVDVTDDLLPTGYTVEINKSNPESNIATLTFKSDVFGNTSLDVGTAVVIQRGSDGANLETIFRGAIERYNYSGGAVTVEVRDPLWRLRYQLLTKSYDQNTDASQGKISEIARDMIVTQAGLSATVTDSGEIFLLAKFISNDDDIRERLYTLAKVLNWVVYYNHQDDTIHFEPEGTTTYSTDLIVGTNIQNIPRWEVDKTNMRNKFKVKGAIRRGWNRENFSGDGSTTEFTLTFTPKDTQVFVGGTLQTRGVTDGTGTFDYSIDEDNKKLTFESAPGSGSDNIEANYSYDIPQPVISRNQDSIDKYGLQEGARYFDDIRTITDARIRGSKVIERMGVPFNRTTINTFNVHGVAVANKVHVIDNVQNQELDLTVQKITLGYPNAVDELEIGDEDFRLQDFISNVAERIRELERKELTNEDILINVFDFASTATPKRRYFKLQTRDTTADGVWDRGFNNSAGTGVLNWDDDGAVWDGEGYTASAVDHVIIPGQNTFNEYVDDTEFYDSDNSTGSWSATAYGTFKKGQITLADGEVVVTLPVAKGIQHSFFTLDLGTATGTDNLTTEISFDNGSNYQTASEGLRTAVTNAGTAVLVKLTASGGPVTIENTYLSVTGHDDGTTGEIIEPALQLTLED